MPWEPDPSSVGRGEMIGRRAFIPPFNSDGSTFKSKVFFDKRKGGLSLDRLSASGSAAKAVVSFLTPQCLDSAESQRKTFHGWICFTHSAILDHNWFSRRGFMARPSRIEESPYRPANPYHSDLVQDGEHQAEDAETLSIILAHLVTIQGTLVPPRGVAST